MGHAWGDLKGIRFEDSLKFYKAPLLVRFLGPV